MRPGLAITMGDPAGVGPEILLKVLRDGEVSEICEPLVVGDGPFLEGMGRRLSIPVRFEGDTIDVAGSRYRIVSPSRLGGKVVPGKPMREASLASIRYIEEAVRMALEGKVHGIVTCPVNKESLKAVGFPFPGHTEFLAHLTGTRDFAMMMVGGGLKVTLVTIHLSLREAIEGVRKERVLKTIRLTHRCLVDRFSIPDPRIGVCGLNPHAGEGGHFGREEIEIIGPAVEEARSEGIDAIGPLPSDTAFYRAKKGEFHGVVAMYHDQGLIPVKLLAFGRAVNVTLGLPIIRTSVDHGTAYDIAGRGVADPSSLLEAIRLASSMKGRGS